MDKVAPGVAEGEDNAMELVAAACAGTVVALLQRAINASTRRDFMTLLLSMYDA
jgi:hypothetical protein